MKQPIDLDDLPETQLDDPRWPTLENYLDEYYQQLGTQGEGGKTYFTKFDEALEGLRGIVIIGGEPGSGKTALAMQIGFDTALDGQPVVIYSFEMPKPQLVTRLFQRAGRLYYKTLQNPYEALSKDARFVEAKEKIAKAGERIIIRETRDFFKEDDQGSVTPVFDFKEQIRHINEMAGEYGKPPLVIIDSLHEIPVDQKYSRELKIKIDYLMLNLRNMCDQTGSTFLLISHQSRSGQKDGGLNSFLGSASIEYTVDMALNISKPTSGDLLEGDRELTVAKNRYGPKPKAFLSFDGKHMDFTFIDLIK